MTSRNQPDNDSKIYNYQLTVIILIIALGILAWLLYRDNDYWFAKIFNKDTRDMFEIYYTPVDHTGRIEIRLEIPNSALDWGDKIESGNPVTRELNDWETRLRTSTAVQNLKFEKVRGLQTYSYSVAFDIKDWSLLCNQIGWCLTYPMLSDYVLPDGNSHLVISLHPEFLGISSLAEYYKDLSLEETEKSGEKAYTLSVHIKDGEILALNTEKYHVDPRLCIPGTTCQGEGAFKQITLREFLSNQNPLVFDITYQLGYYSRQQVRDIISFFQTGGACLLVFLMIAFAPVLFAKLKQKILRGREPN